jgi:hypothetical protein
MYIIDPLISSPNGEITHGDGRLKINEIIDNTPTFGALCSYQNILNTVDTTNQTPTVTDTPIQVTFGGAQSTTEFDLSADGSITCNVSGNYWFSILLQVARAGTSGTAFAYIRLKLNGVQISTTILLKLQSVDTAQPVQFFFPAGLAESNVLTVEFMRGSEGTNEGFLSSLTPLATGWADVGSAALSIEKILIPEQ